jgi:serine/threonine protein kinase
VESISLADAKNQPPRPDGPQAMGEPHPPTTAQARKKLPAVPGYEILGVLGRGGMGVVYKAWQTSLKRMVALKMILAGSHAGRQELTRFRREAEAVARLQHPNIVQIYDIGEADNLPYFSLEFVSGGSLARHLAGTPLGPRKAAELTEVLARAMHHAHRRDLVHRDLKPANVLVTKNGVPKVTDFGLAKYLEEEGEHPTRSGAVMGTPSYMAPEQAEGKTRLIGPAVDVYALGAILYEMVTGRAPFKAETPLDTILQVISEEPVPPRRLQSKVPRDLQTICLTCLAKDPRHRYPSARALADDLRRFLEGAPIQVRSPGKLGRFGKWCKSHPVFAVFLGVIVLALGWGIADSIRLFFNLSSLRSGQNQTPGLVNNRPTVRVDPRRTTKSLRVVPEIVHGKKVWSLAISSDGKYLATGGDGQNVRVWKAATRQLVRVLAGHTDRVTSLAFSPTRPWLASASLDGSVRLWDLKTGKAAVTFREHRRAVWSVAFCPDGNLLASGGADLGVRIWQAPTGRQVRTLSGPADNVTCVTFSPKGNLLAATGWDRTVRVWDASTLKELYQFTGHACRLNALVFHPNGQRIASAGVDGIVQVWDARTGTNQLCLRAGEGEVYGLAFSPSGDWLAAACGDRFVRLWQMAAAKQQYVFRDHLEAATAVAFSPDARYLASGSWDKTIRVREWPVKQPPVAPSP